MESKNAPKEQTGVPPRHINRKYIHGATLLHSAAFFLGRVWMGQYLLERGADFVLSGLVNVEFVQIMLLDHGADINIQN
jgi:hypothetical protein